MNDDEDQDSELGDADLSELYALEARALELANALWERTARGEGDATMHAMWGQVNTVALALHGLRVLTEEAGQSIESTGEGEPRPMDA